MGTSFGNRAGFGFTSASFDEAQPKSPHPDDDEQTIEGDLLKKHSRKSLNQGYNPIIMFKLGLKSFAKTACPCPVTYCFHCSAFKNIGQIHQQIGEFRYGERAGTENKN